MFHHKIQHSLCVSSQDTALPLCFITRYSTPSVFHHKIQHSLCVSSQDTGYLVNLVQDTGYLNPADSILCPLTSYGIMLLTRMLLMRMLLILLYSFPAVSSSKYTLLLFYICVAPPPPPPPCVHHSCYLQPWFAYYEMLVILYPNLF